MTMSPLTDLKKDVSGEMSNSSSLLDQVVVGMDNVSLVSVPWVNEEGSTSNTRLEHKEDCELEHECGLSDGMGDCIVDEVNGKDSNVANGNGKEVVNGNARNNVSKGKLYECNDVSSLNEFKGVKKSGVSDVEKKQNVELNFFTGKDGLFKAKDICMWLPRVANSSNDKVIKFPAIQEVSSNNITQIDGEGLWFYVGQSKPEFVIQGSIFFEEGFRKAMNQPEIDWNQDNKVLFRTREYVDWIGLYGGGEEIYKDSIEFFLNDSVSYSKIFLLKSAELTSSQGFCSLAEYRSNQISRLRRAHSILFRNLGIDSKRMVLIPPPCKVLDNLYIGCAQNSFSVNQLMKCGIVAILNVATECENHFPQHFEYHKIFLKDNNDADAKQYFQMTFEFIEKYRCSGKGVFCHCFMGMSRSCCILIAYLMRKKSWTFRQAFMYLQKRRPQMDVNYKFLYQLLEYEEELNHRNTKKS